MKCKQFLLFSQPRLASHPHTPHTYTHPNTLEKADTRSNE